jgi:hypothetical protein
MLPDRGKGLSAALGRGEDAFLAIVFVDMEVG